VTVSAEALGCYLFGDFKVDLASGCLIRGTKERPLRHQSFQVLLYFLEHPGILISKEELITAIWSDTAVTDNALAQCIAEIRRELRDNSRNPQYIKTYPKVGYRFIAQVESARVSVPEEKSTTLSDRTDTQVIVELPVTTSLCLPEQALPVAPTVRLWSQLRLAAILLVLLAGACLVWHSSNNSKPKLVSAASNAPTLAVFSLRNESGRHDLDWLREGLSDMILTDLAHTVRWKVLSREKVHELLDDGNSSQAPRLERALDAARSVHATAFVVGSVSEKDQQMQITVETRDGNDGRLIATDRAILSDPRQIVAEASLLSGSIAHHLGFADGATPSLAEVMTSNVEAYRYYSVGLEKAEQFQNPQAIDYFKKAIQFDPHFAMAFARIGFAYAVRDFQPEKGRPYLEQALRLSERLPELNRLYIQAWYAISKSEYSNAIPILQQIVSKYPNETEAYCQLSRLLRGQEKVQEAAALLHGAIQKNPGSGDLYNNLGLILSSMGNLPGAMDAYKQYTMLAPQNPNSHDSLGMAYQQAGQYEMATAEYERALELDPEFEPSILHLGDTYYQQGRYVEALREYRRYIQVVQSDDAKALGYGSLSAVYLAQGKLAEAREAANREIQYNRNSVWNSLEIALLKHEQERALKLQQVLFANLPNPERGSPHDVRTEFFYHGYLELKTGDQQGAISHFRAALQHLPPSSGMDLHEDCLANAYLEIGMLPDAISEYQRILKANPTYPLAYYHLAKAYDRMGDRQDATSTYQKFLAVNAYADPDSPAMQDAKHHL